MVKPKATWGNIVTQYDQALSLTRVIAFGLPRFPIMTKLIIS